ncbi:MAG: energy transducer TonB [Bryobacteraceae bacterium]|jgi:TonB family protein
MERLKRWLLWKAPLALALWSCVVLESASGLRIAEAQARRAALEKPSPVYPLVARQLKISGTVRVEASVDEQGEVEYVKIVTGNAIFAKPVVEAVEKWRFTPFNADGKPSKAVVALSFEFR